VPAGLLVGHRQAYRHLAIILLAELATVLPRHAYRVPALLGKAGVVDDPGRDRTERRQHLVACCGQKRLIRPGRLGDEMVQRLVRSTHPLGPDPSRHRLDALALTRQDQAAAVSGERLRAISVRQGARKGFDVSCKPLLQCSRHDH